MVAVDARRDPRWEAFVSGHPQATIYHHPGWMAALEAEYGRRCIALACEEPGGQLRGILPLMTTAGLPWGLGGPRTRRRLSSLPRTPLAGPLAIDHEAERALLSAAIDLVRADGSLQLEVKSHAPLHDVPDGLVRVPWRQAFVLDLPRDPQTLRFGNARNHARIRWSINKAARCGVHVRAAEAEAELQTWYRIYLKTMRWHALPPRAYRFFAALWKELHPIGLLHLLLAEDDVAGRRRVLAGSIILSYGRTASYAFNGCHRDVLALRPNDVIQWHAIHDASTRGLRWYDLGEVTEDHALLAVFKKKWGATARDLHRYYYPAPAAEGAQTAESGMVKRAARAVWRRMPLPITSQIGERLYARL